MLVIFGALALMVGVIASLALESWWILVGVMALHGIASAIVVGFALHQADMGGDKPDPVTAARIEEEGSPGERERMRREALGS
jgi:membrane protein implicated in regulation of membrane protease activity